MKTLPTNLATLLLLFSLAPACAQTVYRCGPDGREYSQAPCPAGREVDVSDARSADQRQAAAAVTQGQHRLADQLAAERRARERSAPAHGPAGIRRGGPGDDVESILSRHSSSKVKKKKAARPQKASKPAKGLSRAT
jgi:hypothetical protein